MGQWLKLVAADGARLAAYRADPASVPRGGLVVVQEIFGVNSHVRAVCDGFAADGYAAVAPAIFDRVTPDVDLGYTPEDIERGRDLKAKTTLDGVLADVAAAREALAGTGRIGVIGYCFGGYVVWMAAARLDGFACAVPYYGGGMLEAVGERPRCAVLAHFGERDSYLPAAGVREFARAHPEATVHFYAADHGFNCDQRGSYDATAARLARERTVEFLRAKLG